MPLGAHLPSCRPFCRISESTRRRRSARLSRSARDSQGRPFQIITEYSATDLIYDPQYLGVQRSDGVVIVQITLSAGRKPPQKRKLFQRMAEILEESPGLPRQDLLINLVETAWENWSFGNGEAQYMDA